MIFHWNDLHPKNAQRIGEHGIVIGALSTSGLPIADGFCLSADFFSNLLKPEKSSELKKILQGSTAPDARSAG